MQERCARCLHDPFENVGIRLGPLSMRQFLRNFGWRLLIGMSILGWLVWREGDFLVQWYKLPSWAQIGMSVLIAIALLTLMYQLWLTWQASQVALVLTPAEAWLYQRRGGRVYFERMSWLECLPPAAARGWHLLEALGALIHIILHAGLQWLAFLVPDQVYELRLRSRFDSGRQWRLALVGAQHHPRFTLTHIALFALPYWLQSGIVRIEPGYEPSPDRKFLALDMSTCTLRAYAFSEVRLDEGTMSIRHESRNPDGSLVENDHSLDADAAHAHEREQRALVELNLPAYAVPYGDYWLRADWNLIKRIEHRRAASEAATMPVQTPKPA